jgi:hypothetical protein
MNEWDKARVEIKKMHERESIIAEFRSKELDAAKAKAREKSLSATAPKDLNGYPIETLTDPEVRSLKNSYESAFANYLAGFVYESQGDISLAAPGYRKAAEMRPNIPLIDRGLSELDTRAGKKQNPNLVDTLIVIETGEAPQVISKSVPIPIPTPKGLEITAMSWPVVQPDNLNKRPTAVKIDGQPVEFATLTDVNPMARRAISDEMPGIIARSSIRAITRAASQYAIDQANSQNTGNAALVGALFSLATKIATVATEVADTRIWRTLPGHYSISRTQLPAGIHQIEVATATGTTQRDFVVSSGKYSFVELRSYGNNVYVTPSPILPVSVPVARLDNTIVAIQKMEKYQR